MPSNFFLTKPHGEIFVPWIVITRVSRQWLSPIQGVKYPFKSFPQFNQFSCLDKLVIQTKVSISARSTIYL